MNGWIEPPPQRPARLGCIGKSCLILAGFIVFLLIAAAIGLYYGMRTDSAVLHGVSLARKTHLLATEPSPIPRFETTDENIQATRHKVEDFETTPAGQTAGETNTVELSADELNNLIARNRQARGKVFASIEGNRLRVQTSIPLGEYLAHSGYYANGDIVVQGDGPQSLDAPRFNTITINNQPVPPGLLDWSYRGRSLRDYLGEFKTKYGIQTVDIRDGKLIVTKQSQ